MFHDKNEELKRLENELLEDEEYSAMQEDPSFSQPQYEDELYTDLQAYNADRTELDPDDLSDALLEPEEPSVQGPLLTALFLILGIFLVVCWWMVRYLGVL